MALGLNWRKSWEWNYGIRKLAYQRRLNYSKCLKNKALLNPVSGNPLGKACIHPMWQAAGNSEKGVLNKRILMIMVHLFHITCIYQLTMYLNCDTNSSRKI
jgi:hypothetical protein